MSLSEVKALAFDTGGTVLNWHRASVPLSPKRAHGTG
jgi:hypothetical protein